MIGEVRIYHGQRYVCVGQESYTRKRDGSQTAFLIWESACAECYDPIRVRTVEGAAAFAPSRRCHWHKKPGLRAGVVELPPSSLEPQKTSAPAASQQIEPASAFPSPEPALLFAKGDRVSHKKFGNGVVLAVAEDGTGCQYAEVLFDYQGSKLVLDSFLDLVTPAATCSSASGPAGN
jgi:hypothetical protein